MCTRCDEERAKVFQREEERRPRPADVHAWMRGEIPMPSGTQPIDMAGFGPVVYGPGDSVFDFFQKASELGGYRL